MKKIDLERAIAAFRWACPNKSVLKKLDGKRQRNLPTSL